MPNASKVRHRKCECEPSESDKEKPENANRECKCKTTDLFKDKIAKQKEIGNSLAKLIEEQFSNYDSPVTDKLLAKAFKLMDLSAFPEEQKANLVHESVRKFRRLTEKETKKSGLVRQVCEFISIFYKKFLIFL